MTSRLPAPLALAGAVLVGALTALQARVNGQLGQRLGDGLTAAVISFASGLVIVVALSLATSQGRAGMAALRRGLRERSIPWWMLAGGVAGALTVATQGLVVGIIGVSLFSVGVVAGQSVNGLVLDRVGYGPAGVVAVTPRRVVAAALAVLAVAVSLVGGSFTGVAWWMLLLPFLAGVGIAWQQATNGRLRQRVGSPLTATLVNFIGGTAVLGVAASVHLIAAGPPRGLPSEPWVYLGGAIGVTYIFLSAAIVAQTGVLLLGLGAVVGQLLTSVLIDLAWPAPASPGSWQSVAMIAVALTSVAVATVPFARGPFARGPFARGPFARAPIRRRRRS